MCRLLCPGALRAAEHMIDGMLEPVNLRIPTSAPAARFNQVPGIMFNTWFRTKAPQWYETPGSSRQTKVHRVKPANLPQPGRKT